MNNLFWTKRKRKNAGNKMQKLKSHLKRKINRILQYSSKQKHEQQKQRHKRRRRGGTFTSTLAFLPHSLPLLEQLVFLHFLKCSYLVIFLIKIVCILSVWAFVCIDWCVWAAHSGQMAVSCHVVMRTDLGPLQEQSRWSLNQGAIFLVSQFNKLKFAS